MAYIKHTDIVIVQDGDFVDSHKPKVETHDTGGGCLVDVVFLNDGTILCISDDYVGLYSNEDAFYEGESELGGFERPLGHEGDNDA